MKVHMKQILNFRELVILHLRRDFATTRFRTRKPIPADWNELRADTKKARRDHRALYGVAFNSSREDHLEDDEVRGGCVDRTESEGKYWSAIEHGKAVIEVGEKSWLLTQDVEVHPSYVEEESVSQSVSASFTHRI